MIRLLYECDKKKCNHCSYPICSHTADIAHAVNFKQIKSQEGEVLAYEEKRKMPIKELGLPVQTENILLRAGINSTRQIENMTEDELKALPRMTKPSLKRIKEIFKKYDLYLKANERGANK